MGWVGVGSFILLVTFSVWRSQQAPVIQIKEESKVPIEREAADIKSIPVIGSDWSDRFLIGNNHYRDMDHKVPLIRSSILDDSAQKKAIIIAKSNTFAHVVPGMRLFSDTMGESGILDRRGQTVGENLICGWAWQEPEELMKILYESPEHKENIVFDRYRYVGFGYSLMTVEGWPCVVVVTHYAVVL